MQGIIVFILVFFIVVTIHELGHFIVAKKSGILCQEFAIGFGPKIFHKKIGETNFTVRMLPVGGYVKMPDNVFDFNNEVSLYDIKKGMRVFLKLDDNNNVEKIILDNCNDINFVQLEVDEYDFTEKLFIKGFTNSGQEIESFNVNKNACVVFNGLEEQIAPVERMFSSHSWFKKFATLFAGPLMNFVLAAFIFIGMAIYTGHPTNEAILGKVIENSPAQKSGLKENDKIIEINNQKIETWDELTSNIVNSKGEKLSLKVNRNNNLENIILQPEEKIVKDNNGNDIKRYVIGIEIKYEKNILKSVSYGLKQTLYYGTLIFQGIVGLFISLFKGGFSLDHLGGPVAIYEMTSDVAKNGLMTTLRWIGLLSVNLGLMNLIPIPVFDGGRIVFVLYEAIFGKPISKKMQYYVTATFGILLIALMLAVTWNDVSRLFNK